MKSERIPAERADKTKEKLREKLRENTGFLAGLSVLGAVLVSSCCILPLVFVTIGVSGAWIGTLTALEPYRVYIILATLVVLGMGYWQVYFKSPVPCEDQAYCASPSSGRLVRGALWLATLFILIAATIDYWAPYFY